MKPFLLLTTLSIILFFSCGDKKNQSVPQTGDKTLFAVWLDTSGYWQADLITRGIVKNIKYDSLKKVDRIIYDTVFAKKIILPQLENGKQKKDSAGNPVFQWHWQYIGRDSVDLNIQNVDIDSLLKARNTKKTSPQ